MPATPHRQQAPRDRRARFAVSVNLPPVPLPSPSVQPLQRVYKRIFRTVNARLPHSAVPAYISETACLQKASSGARVKVLLLNRPPSMLNPMYRLNQSFVVALLPAALLC